MVTICGHGDLFYHSLRLFMFDLLFYLIALSTSFEKSSFMETVRNQRVIKLLKKHNNSLKLFKDEDKDIPVDRSTTFYTNLMNFLLRFDLNICSVTTFFSGNQAVQRSMLETHEAYDSSIKIGKAISDAWILFLSLPLPLSVYKNILINFDTQVMHV